MNEIEERQEYNKSLIKYLLCICENSTLIHYVKFYVIFNLITILFSNKILNNNLNSFEINFF